MPITPQQLAKGGQERDEQVAFFQWLALTASKRYPQVKMAHAVPNGAKLMGVGTDVGRAEGGRMKAEGLRAGVPDVFVAAQAPRAPLGTWPGLYIEFKKLGRHREKNGGRSDDQVKWHGWLREQGYAVVTAYGWQAGAQAVADYFAGTICMPDTGDCLFVLEQANAPW